MAYAETSTNVTLQLEENDLATLMEKFNWTSVKTAVCASSSEMVVIWIIFSIEFVVMCLALYGLCCLFRSNQAVPLFIINLFVCDIIQICVKPVLNFCTLNVQNNVFFLVFHVYIMSIVVNIGFMVCISVERYVMIKYPVWYRLHHSCRNLFLICLFVWATLCGYMVIDIFIALKVDVELAFLLNVIMFLLPYPLVVFCFVGSWKALSHSVAVTPDERKRILIILALVLFSYTVLFLPSIVQNIIFAVSFKHGISSYYDSLHSVSGIMLYLNPLADSLLYIFIRKDANSMFRFLCCKKLHENQV
ncbi:G-protein coupled receptor 4-like isoform X1 [Labeo rohita]|uniref:G-protein coupled receptor 4-like isoform X1 n=1 Tax=Labeo rohita TaxID=84645 RepID=UPI0021E264C4|nr:G-protein coupled receptor 4-like isoform X1 [Labeo rohita]XP_050969827.1 G-protein coupled receptor 4-like isoform X1 [Labeo rohita]